MTEAEQCRRAIERCEAKREKVSDAASKLYYTLCIRGWELWLAKVEAEEG